MSGKKIELAVVIPQYGQLEYTEAALASLFKNTRCGVHAVVIDDASPGVDSDAISLMVKKHAQASFFRFEENGGLNQAWNKGLELMLGPVGQMLPELRDIQAVCVTNNDVLFSPGWDEPLMRALQSGYSLVGPVTNAPGTESSQMVTLWDTDYGKVSDSDQHLDEVATRLRGRYMNVFGVPKMVKGSINGFCMMGSRTAWLDNKYDSEHFFRPKNEFNSKGERNPTPLMTLNEYELQSRWHKAGLKTGFCPASYVLHYRAVTRGKSHRRGMWLRRDKDNDKDGPAVDAKLVFTSALAILGVLGSR